MKKILTILFTVLSCTAMAQKPVQTLGNKGNIVKVLGELGADSAILFPKDTIQLHSTDRAIAFKGTNIYQWDGNKWGLIAAASGTSGSILNDSTFLLCNSNGCDTFKVKNITVTNFSFLTDSTVRICNSAGSCDTISFPPVPLNKFYVDSVLISHGTSFDTLRYFINGKGIIGGYIGSQFYNKTQIDSIFTATLQNYYTQTQIDSLNTIYGVTNNSNRIISGGIVTWSGTGLTYYVSACIYEIGGVLYNSPDTTITLTAADATNPRIDLFAVDTLGRALKITGVAASVPLAPQIDPSSQLALTTGINLPANATTPTGTTSIAIYDENTEWTTGGTATVNYNNTANPYHGTKDAYVSSYSKNQTLTFTGTNQTVNGQTLRAFIYLNNSNYNFQFQFFNGTTAVSNNLTLSGYSPTLYNVYQNVSIPLTAFSWSATTFNKLVITMTGKGGTGTYYIDYITLEGGTTVVPPQTDYSYKVDSVKNRNDSLFWVTKGVYFYTGFNAYQKAQTDSITAQLRSEIVSAAGGGVISFNGRNGAVISDSTDYNSFFYTKHLTDSLLALKISAANLSLGTVTSTSQVINNSAGTGVTLPSASISTAGLETAADKVAINTISSKLAIADTSSMLSPYLRKSDAFTKTQADLLYRPITYVPAWSEITGKPTIPAPQIKSDWNQTDTSLLDYIKNKPTIPTNNNQLTNGAGYITSIDSANFLHKGDSSLYVTQTQNSLSHTDSLSFHSASLNSDSTQLSLTRANGTKDTIPLPFVKKTDTTVIKVHYPVWAFSSDSLGLRIDSMPKLEYAIAGRDTSTWDNQTLIDKQFLQDKISTVTATGITRTELQDTAAAIRSAIGSGSGSTNVNIGSGYRLAVPFTNNIKTIFSVSPIIIDSVTNSNALTFTFDTTNHHTTAYYNTVYGSLSQQNTNTTNIASNTANIASNTTAIAGKQNTITLTTTGSGAASLAGSTLNIPTPSIPAQFNPVAGTNITLSGTYPNITFNASGGTIAGLYQKLTATAGQTAFTFTLIPTDANKVGFYINGSFVSQSFYTVSGNTITFTSGLQLNDVVEEQGVQ